MHDPRWWAPARRIVTFLLGCAVTIDALVQTPISIGALIIGLLLTGVMPIDDLIRIVLRDDRHQAHGDDPQ